MKTSKLWYRFIAKLLIYLMIIQSFPYWQLSELYSWEYKPERAKRIIEFIGSAFSPVEASAAPPQVICVPQLPTDLLVPHDTWPDESVILKGIARDADDNLSGGTYYWDFGDGTQSAVQTISNADNLSTTHTYTDDEGTLIIARLHVTDAAGETASDDYRVVVKAKTLDVEVNKAIDDGLWWLYTNKENYNSYYRWNNARYGNHYNNSTASAVQAFEINGHLETGDPDEDPYVEVVIGGIDYLFSQMSSVNIGVQTYGDPDANDNGIGITVSGSRQIYELGAVMDALVASGTPDAVAPVGGANVVGRRYQDIVQDMCDMYAWGQYDHSTVGGGWRYNWGDSPDNSASQWAAIGMIAAEQHFGCTVPQWVKDRNNVWLDYSNNSSGFGYANTSGTTFSTIASGMVQLAFDGFDGTDSRWQTAENYVDNNWASFISVSRNNRYYSYYSFTKAMRLAEPQEVTHLPSGLDWYGDETQGLARILVDRQNTNGDWAYDGWPYVGERTAAAWNIIILTRTLFEKPPVAMIDAEPNPGAVGQHILLDASGSYHVDPAKSIISYLWDFDASDGVDFENPDATGITAEAVYGELGSYTASLKVVDDSTPARFDTTTLSLAITIPPHPPTAVIGGPYIAVVDEDLQLDGSGSYDVDESEGDVITAWNWETDFIAPYDFDEASGEVVTIGGFSQAGNYDIALRVTDNTATVFPQTGSPDLTHMDYGQVTVFNPGVTDLAARPKATKCQLTWTDVGAAPYEVLRSSAGPNHGFELIGSTDSTYSTFLDYNVELYTDYWYRIRCVHNGETTLSGPVHVNSQGRIRNLPPTITSSPVVDAQEGQVFNYAVQADDPEGTALTFYLDQAPNGMTIDAAGGLITWTPAFADVGLTDVTVRVEDAGRASASQFFQITVQPRPNTAPIPDPGGPYEGLINTAVSFDASGTSDPEGDSITSFHWNFGDGTEGYGQTIDHTYTATATYTVTLYVTDDRGATASAETVCQIESPNRPPVAVITGPDTGEADVPMAFTALDSSDPDGDSLTYTWNFGDSTPAETGNTVLHTYNTAGAYTVSLSADDGRGGLDTAELEVVISEPNQTPEAAFTVSGDLTRLATVTFDGSASSDPEGEPIASYDWDFGDGTATTGAIVTHGYDTAGDYTVTLTVTDDKGAAGTRQQSITILPIMVTVPDVTGAGQTEAETAITTATLTVGSINTVHHATVPAGQVIAQEPVSGTIVAENSAVSLTISLGPVMVSVPNVVGVPQTDAENLIAAGNLQLGSVTTATSDTVPTGSVISQDPAAGISVAENSLVSIVISAGPAPVAVPAVIGMTQAEAQIAIGDTGLTVGNVTSAYDNAFAAGLVSGQTPASGTLLPPASPVDIVISLGPEPVAVPNVIGMTQAGAQSALSAVALTMGTVTSVYSETIAAGEVVDQTPTAGSMVLPGTTVNVTVSQGPAPIAVPDVIGLTQAAAQSAIISAGFTVGSISTAYSDTVPEGSVVNQTPAAGSMALPGSPVNLTLSAGAGEADNENPSLRVSYNADPPAYDQGDSIVMTIVASDDSGVAYVEVTVDGAPVASSVPTTTLDSGALSFGSHEVNVTATDPSGNAVAEKSIFVIRDPSDTDTPTVEITGPIDGGTLTDEVNVTGTAFDDNLFKYELAYAPIGTDNYTVFYTGTETVSDDVLGIFDPALVLNGMYSLRLSVYDGNGRIAMDTITVRCNAEQEVGNFSLTFPDMTVNIGNMPLTVNRVYDSRRRGINGDFGHGWSVELVKGLKAEPNGDLGAEWTQTTSGGWFPSYCIAPATGSEHYVLVTYPGGRQEQFNLQARLTTGSTCRAVYPINNSWGVVEVYFSEGSMGSSLEVVGESSGLSLSGGVLLDSSLVETWNASRFRLTTAEGWVYVVDETDGLISMQEPNGDTVTIGQSGIIHSAGYSITFTRDGQGRITQMAEPDGNVRRYSYDDRGDLVVATDREGYDTQMTYNSSHGLLKYEDALGRIAHQNEYNESGRLVAIIDGEGRRSEITQTPGTNQEVVTDFEGNLIIIERDTRGNAISETDHQGRTTHYEYDADNNLTRKEDPQGNVWAWTWDDHGNKLSETLPGGATTTWEYNSMNKVTRMVDALGNETLTTYDAQGNVTGGTDAAGYSYNQVIGADGKVTSFTDKGGYTYGYQYDAQGRKIREDKPDGSHLEWTYNSAGAVLTKRHYDADSNLLDELIRSYDRKGNLLQSESNGDVTTFEYDGNGNLIRETDPSGAETEHVYDSSNNLVGTVYPDGNSKTLTTNSSGNPTGYTSPSGVTLGLEYNQQQQVTKLTYADGGVTEYTYDDAGNRIAVNDRGAVTQYTYDGRGQMTSQTDALGNVTTYSYDNNGNKVSMTDANGNNTGYEYDVLDRMTRVVYADGSERGYEYDGLGRKTAEIDQNGNRMEYTYDSAGNLTSATNAMGETTTFTYDQSGNRLTETDPLGNVTAMAYDQDGRLLSKTFPGGLIESHLYDASGNLIEFTDRAGDITSRTYDARNQLVQIVYPNGKTVTYDYTADGKVTTKEGSDGSRIDTTFDLMGRVSRVDYNDGRWVSYTYDARGNRTSVSTPEGSTGYDYDILGRLLHVTDQEGGITSYEYDAVGNLISVAHANGVTTTHTYDVLNRLTDMETQSSDGTLLAGHHYTLAANGMRTRIDEVVNGMATTMYYTYDLAYRLIEEVQEDLSGTVIYGAEYTYDSAGNRLTKTIASAAVTTYTYNGLNQLISEESPVETVTYTYNELGQLINKTGSVSGTLGQYAYNEIGKLNWAENEAAVVSTYVYDLNGNLSEKGVDGVIERYLVEPDANLPEILVTYDNAGSVSATYTFGHDLLKMRRYGSDAYYHTDGLGSTRLLTDTGEAVTDTYRYEAFGTVLDAIGSTDNVHLFTGERFDANIGFYYLRARMYDPSTGRFHSVDPFDGLIHDPVTLHKYLYAANNPVNYTDPSGEFFGGLVGISIGMSMQSLLVSWNMMYLKVMITALKIADCVLQPLYTNRWKLLDAMAGGLMTNGIFEEYAAVMKGISEGYFLMARSMAEEIFKFANKLMVPVKIKFGKAETLLEFDIAEMINSGAPGAVPTINKLKGFKKVAREMVKFLAHKSNNWCEMKYDIIKSILSALPL